MYPVGEGHFRGFLLVVEYGQGGKGFWLFVIVLGGNYNSLHDVGLFGFQSLLRFLRRFL